jgi:hypothetical protein
LSCKARCAAPRFWFGLGRGHSVVRHLTQNRRRPSETRVGFGEGWILADGFLEIGNAAAQIVSVSPSKFALMVGVAGLGNLRRSGVHGADR